MHLISIFSPLEYLNTDKTSPELGSSHIAKLYFLPMQNSHPTPPKKKEKKKKAWIFSWGWGWRSKGKVELIREPRGGGVRPAAIPSLHRLLLWGHRGRRVSAGGETPGSGAAPLGGLLAQHLREAFCVATPLLPRLPLAKTPSCQVSSFKLLRVSYWSAVLVCLSKPV